MKYILKISLFTVAYVLTNNYFIIPLLKITANQVSLWSSIVLACLYLFFSQAILIRCDNQGFIRHLIANQTAFIYLFLIALLLVTPVFSKIIL